MHLVKHLFIILLSLTVISCASFKPHQDEGLIPMNKNIKMGILDNGLTYYVYKTDSSLKEARMMLVVNAGSVDETDEQRGAASFVAHMAFNGTRNFPGKTIDKFIDDTAMDYRKFYSNKASYDETRYTLDLSTDDKSLIEGGLLILSDIANGVLFTDEDLKRERKILMEIWDSQSSASADRVMKYRSALYKGSKYAERNPYNAEPFVENLTREALVSYYEDWYRPENMAVIVAGDLDDKEMVQMIKKKFSTLTSASTAPVRQTYDISARTEPEYVTSNDSLYDTFSLKVTIAEKKDARRTKDDIRDANLARVIYMLINERMKEHINTPNPPFNDVYYYSSPMLRTMRIHTLNVVFSDQDIQTGLDIFFDEFSRIAQHGFSSAEFEKAHSMTTKNLEEQHTYYTESARRMANSILRNYLTGDALPDKDTAKTLSFKTLNEITLKDANDEISRVLKLTPWLISTRTKKGAKDQFPGYANIKEGYSNILTKTVDRHVPKKRSVKVLTANPVPGSVVSEKKVKKHGYTEWKLSNGATVVVRPTKTWSSEPEINFLAISPGGTSLADDESYPSAVFASKLVKGGGIGDMDLFELMEFLESKKIHGLPSISELEEAFFSYIKPENMETTLTLMYLYMTEPRKDPEAFKRAKEERLKYIEEDKNNPYTAKTDLYIKIFNNNHPRRILWNEKMLSSVDMDKAFNFYKERFDNASDFTFLFIGDVDTDKIKPLVEKYIGGLPSTGKKETWRDIGLRHPRGVINERLVIGTQKRATITLAYGGPFEFDRQTISDINKMSMLLEGRLRDMIRTDFDSTFTVSVGPIFNRFPVQEYIIDISIQCSPARTDEVVAKSLKVIENVRNGIDLDAPANALIKLLKTEKEQEEREAAKKDYDDTNWMKILVDHYLYGDSIEEGLMDKLQLERATPKIISSTAKKYLDPKNRIKIIMLHGR